MSELVYLGIAALLLWALWRRPQEIVVVLAVTFLLAVGGGEVVHDRGTLRAGLIGLDGLVVVAMWWLWHRYRSDRAKLIATLGLLKIWLGIAAALTALPWQVWASAYNGLFVVQVLIAGGFSDGVMAWVGRCAHRLRARERRSPGYLEKAR